jgi:hypothetical protein
MRLKVVLFAGTSRTKLDYKLGGYIFLFPQYFLVSLSLKMKSGVVLESNAFLKTLFEA